MTRIESSRRYRWSGYLLGFALGGFFDGILLHQILQWHHLLSAINGSDIRFQVAADGYFHALMYVIAAVGLWMLWASGREADRPAGRLLMATILTGFGVWHITDGILSHWVLGIHRIRMNSENLLFWDLLWFVVFGVVPFVAGTLMRRIGGEGSAPAAPSSAKVRSLAALLVIGAGGQALQPPPSNGFTTVLFVPGTAQERIMKAIDEVDGRLIWADRTGELVVIRLKRDQSRLQLFQNGAVLVSGTGFPAGCFDYLRM